MGEGKHTAPSTAVEPRFAPVAIRAARLRVTEGADAGADVRIASPTFVIGTGENADLRLKDAAVSREHVRLLLSEQGVVVRDEGSRNGTWVGGLRVHHASTSNDLVFVLGATTLALSVETDLSQIPASTTGRFGDALGVSPAMRVVFELLAKAAPTDLTILFEGESGVGKDVLARAVHSRSARAKGPLVTVDCGAIPAHLVESELFGHARGAFTGAVAERKGLFAEAHGGTLFLDEVGELPIEMQPKLLRALEQREVRPIGSNQVQKIDVRVIAATNRRLFAAVERGEFREDLLYRLSVVRITVPPLRDRKDDIVLLARSFLAEGADPLPSEIEGMLLSYAWPGNVRELRNVIQRFSALGVRDRGTLLGAQERSPPEALAVELANLPYQEARQHVVERFERAYVADVLKRSNNVVVRAAEQAGIGRASFYRMLERLGMGGKR